MFMNKLRGLMLGCGTLAVVVANPTPSHAIFHWFKRSCAPAPTYAACNPCAPRVCSYVPQTCYRTQYVSVPVTSYQPSVACDPCTGGQVTTMRPVTTYAYQARMVPYTTYRMAYTSPYAANRLANYAPRVAYYAPPAITYAAPVAPAASNCCASTAAPITTAPAASTPYYGNGANVAPTLPPLGTAAPPLGTAPPTINNYPSGATGIEAQQPAVVHPAPAPVDSSGVKLIDPENRTTQQSRAWNYTPVAWKSRTVAIPNAMPNAMTRPQPTAEPSEADAWRPSNR